MLKGRGQKEMRRVVTCLLLAVVLSLSFATTVLADEGGSPNVNADWGQSVADSTPRGEHASTGAGAPPPWAGEAPNNAPEYHGYPHGNPEKPPE
jgi:hypothetical protein